MSRVILFHLLSNVRAVAVVAFMVAMPVDAMAELVADFYAGKTITIYVGFTAGGGYDLYARQLAPSLTKHIPGKATRHC
jgi:tripartite-type tricarboxylate transporter receptor subunit TctC